MRRFENDCLCVLFMGDGVNVSIDVSFDNMQDWKLIREKAEGINSSTACITYDQTYCWVQNGYYVNTHVN
jgi:hypothetical protein